MPQIEVSQRLYDFLVAEAAKGHHGDIHDYLFSRLSPPMHVDTNRDQKIRELLENDVFTRLPTVREKYLLIFQALSKIDPIRFATLHNFKPQNWERTIFSSSRDSIYRTTTSDCIVQIPNSSFHVLVGLTAKEYQDCAFHAAQHLEYPYPVALEIRKSLEEIPKLDLGFLGI